MKRNPVRWREILFRRKQVEDATGAGGEAGRRLKAFLPEDITSSQ